METAASPMPTHLLLKQAKAQSGGVGGSAHAKLRKNNRYTTSQMEEIIKIYDSHENKSSALRLIKSMEGYNKVERSLIMRWKTKINKDSEPLGRPVAFEFEKEVLEECQKIFDIMQNETREEMKADPYAAYSYAVIRQCAINVINRSYWDEASQSYVDKWKFNPLTKNLLFSNMWICGMLKRNKVQRRPVPPGVMSSIGNAEKNDGGDDDEEEEEE
jgi:hypothetical protein